MTLDAAENWVSLGNRAALLYSFDRQVPGPTIDLRAGDEVRLLFRNGLPEATNLHFRGLHIPPTGNADNVMLRVPPGESLEYRFTVPADHAAGTYWYHPHVHGSTARQLSRGLAGPIVVRNPAESIPEIERAPESILVFQDFDIGINGRVVEPSVMEQMQGREGSLITATGADSPSLGLAEGGLLRLRLINASSSRFYRLKVEEHPLHRVAGDGGLLPRVTVEDEILLTPGERAEVMIHGTRPPGEYRLLNLRYNRGARGMMGRLANTGVGAVGSIRYEGREENRSELPETLKTTEPLGGPRIRRSFQLGQGMTRGGPMAADIGFTINGRLFDSFRTDVRSTLNTVEDWEFINPTTMDHPMHIHTDPFQMLDAAGTPIQEWKDTALVKAGARMTLRTAFRDFTGVRMFHCHILDHEDRGMMATLAVTE